MKINNKIKLAIARYFHNRNKQYIQRRIDGSTNKLVELDTSPNRYQWDKKADQDRIANACNDANLSVSMSSGTFWVSSRGVKKNGVMLNENNYLDGGEPTYRNGKEV